MQETIAVRKKISAEEFANKLNLNIVYGSGAEFELSTRNVNRPGLQLTGMWKFFENERVQVFGPSEIEYLSQREPKQRAEALTEFFGRKFPCLVFSRNLKVPEEIVSFAKKFEIPVFRSSSNTSALANQIADFLGAYLTYEEQIHGVLMDVFGVGVLLRGMSGVGKSEIALELVSRGHRLACDDAVIVKRLDDKIIGYAPPLVRHFSEVRGIGLIDVVSLYGAEAVKLEQQVELVIEMEAWDDRKEYERIGDVAEKENILGVDLVKMTIPVSPGRNLAVIIETAASVYRQRMMGFIAAHELERRMNRDKNK